METYFKKWDHGGWSAGLGFKRFHFHICDFSFGIARQGIADHGGRYSWNPFYVRFRKTNKMGRKFVLRYKVNMLNPSRPLKVWDPYDARKNNAVQN